MQEDTEADRIARKKKIKELEESLFGRENDWISRKTDLPRLQNVDEFSAKFHTAEAKKPSTALPRLKTGGKTRKARTFLQTITKKTNKDEFDGIPLINDESGNEEALEEVDHKDRKVKKSKQGWKSSHYFTFICHRG